jgi:acyl carrier protein
MGLDLVELLLTIEDEFQIAVSDTDAEQCRTVGDAVDLVYSRVRKSENEPCPSQHGFYVVRKKLIGILSVSRCRIRPDTRLDELIRRKNRRASWKRILAELADRQGVWPRLTRPRWLKVVLFVIGSFVFLACFFMCSLLWRSGLTVGDALWFFLFTAFFTALFLGVITVPFKTEFPEGFRFVKDLVKFVKTLDTRIWSREEVFEKVKKLTAEQLDVPESKVTEDADFLKDLRGG